MNHEQAKAALDGQSRLSIKDLVDAKQRQRANLVEEIAKIDAELAEVGISVKPKRERKPRSDKGQSREKPKP